MKHYCLHCGNVLSSVPLDDHLREMCLKCGWVYYPHLKVSAGCIALKENKVLLAKRDAEPWKDHWYLPSGFVEEGETPAQTAAREMEEETGMEVNLGEIFGAFYYNDDPRGDGVVILYEAQITNGLFFPNKEVNEIGFFTREAIPNMLAGMAHVAALDKWMMRIHD